MSNTRKAKEARRKLRENSATMTPAVYRAVDTLIGVLDEAHGLDGYAVSVPTAESTALRLLIRKLGPSACPHASPDVPQLHLLAIDDPLHVISCPRCIPRAAARARASDPRTCYGCGNPDVSRFAETSVVSDRLIVSGNLCLGCRSELDIRHRADGDGLAGS